MHILYIAHRIPYPPNKGEKIRAFHQVRYLSMKHRVHLACLVDDPDDWQHVKALERYCASVVPVYRSRSRSTIAAALAMVGKIPLSVASFYSSQLSSRIRETLRSEKIDRILVYSGAMAEYVRTVVDIPRVMDFVDIDSDKWRMYAGRHAFPRSWIYRVEADRLARYEEQVARSFDRVIVVSEREARLLRERIGNRPLSVIPNGVDLDYFRPSGETSEGWHPPTIVFTGVMDYFPNVDAVGFFCAAILPEIRRALPETRFVIVGRNPTREVKRLGHGQNVVVTGSVADVRPYLEGASVVVAPFRIARGIQNKVLEAMAMQRPVVGTSHAFQGLQATPDDGIWIEDTAEGFAQAIVTLLGSPELRRLRSIQARRYVERHHRWSDYGAQLERLLQEAGA